MKALKKTGIAMIFAIFIGACTPTVKVSSDYDNTADFPKYKTFALYQLTDKDGALTQLNQNRIIAAVKSELTKKGLTESTSNPDLLVNVTAFFKDKSQVTANTNYYGYGGYYRPYAWGPGFGGTTTYSTYNYKDGSLIIDLVDAGSKNLVWTGVGNKEIDKPAKDPEKSINEAVAKILAQYPPGKS